MEVLVSAQSHGSSHLHMVAVAILRRRSERLGATRYPRPADLCVGYAELDYDKALCIEPGAGGGGGTRSRIRL